MFIKCKGEGSHSRAVMTFLIHRMKDKDLPVQNPEKCRDVSKTSDIKQILLLDNKTKNGKTDEAEKIQTNPRENQRDK